MPLDLNASSTLDAVKKPLGRRVVIQIQIQIQNSGASKCEWDKKRSQHLLVDPLDNALDKTTRLQKRDSTTISPNGQAWWWWERRHRDALEARIRASRAQGLTRRAVSGLVPMGQTYNDACKASSLIYQKTFTIT